MKKLPILFICLLLAFSIGCDRNASSENKTPAPARREHRHAACDSISSRKPHGDSEF